MTNTVSAETLSPEYYYIDLALNNIAQKENSSKQTIPYKGMKLKKRKTFETLIMLIF